jgi:hypothetical protein
MTATKRPVDPHHGIRRFTGQLPRIHQRLSCTPLRLQAILCAIFDARLRTAHSSLVHVTRSAGVNRLGPEVVHAEGLVCTRLFRIDGKVLSAGAPVFFDVKDGHNYASLSGQNAICSTWLQPRFALEPDHTSRIRCKLR